MAKNILQCKNLFVSLQSVVLGAVARDEVL